MAKLGAWLPLYVGDYLADTAHLNAQQHGAYLLLLMHQWRNGPLPDDDVLLAAITRCDISSWRKLVAPIVRPFFQASEGRLVQLRLEKIRAEQCSKSERRARAGAEGAAKRWQRRSQTDSNAIVDDDKKLARGVANECQSESESESESETKKSDARRVAGAISKFDPDFGRFWAAYPKKVAKGAAEKAWRAAIKSAPPVQIVASVAAYPWPIDPQYIPNPATWLNQRRWEDQVTLTQASNKASGPSSRPLRTANGQILTAEELFQVST